MTRYESYNIDNDMWYKKRKHIYHLMGVYDGGRCACIIATYSLKTKRLLIKGANKHIPESSILKQFIEYAESKELQEKRKWNYINIILKNKKQYGNTLNNFNYN